MAPRYRITLAGEERKDLEALTRNGKTGAKKFISARTLLLCDAGPDGPAWKGKTPAETATVPVDFTEISIGDQCRGK
jgi:hypothetical protein